MNTTPATDTGGTAGTAAVDTVIIGAGQSGLAFGYYLATGACHLPKTPGFAADLPSDVVQLHSHNYRNPAAVSSPGLWTAAPPWCWPRATADS
jgi:cation diffusion facilitator CzcD-associated flavoprotein CzcO